MDPIWIVLLVAASLIVPYAIVLILESRVAKSGKDAVRGRHVRVQTVRQSKGFTVRTPDGEERTYSSLDEMPYELRCKMEEAQRQGPTETHVRVTRNGETQEFTSERDLPPELRQRLEEIRAGGQGVTIEVDGKTYYYESPDEVPPHLRKFIRP